MDKTLAFILAKFASRASQRGYLGTQVRESSTSTVFISMLRFICPLYSLSKCLSAPGLGHGFFRSLCSSFYTKSNTYTRILTDTKTLISRS